MFHRRERDDDGEVIKPPSHDLKKDTIKFPFILIRNNEVIGAAASEEERQAQLREIFIKEPDSDPVYLSRLTTEVIPYTKVHIQQTEIK